ncbi:MAG: rRNA maturation RNase YbeY, partial [Deltaproteobacteria bacterium]
RLNERYLNRKGPTNVLAFPMSGGPAPDIESAMLGDVVVSVDTARREADVAGETMEKAVNRLLIHGVLHLLGFDHETGAADARRMEREENRLMGLIREE